MDKTIKVILLTNSERLISEITEVGADVGEPDCRLTKPYEIWAEHNLCAWMSTDTDQDTFMISSDKIITIADPKQDLLEKYLKRLSNAILHQRSNGRGQLPGSWL